GSRLSRHDGGVRRRRSPGGAAAARRKAGFSRHRRVESRARPRARHAGYRRGRLARLRLRGDRELRPARGAAGPGRTQCDDRTDRGYAARLSTRAREDAVLLDEVLDDLLLVAVDPSSDDQSQQPQGLKIGRQTPYLPQLFRVCTRHGSAQYSDTTVWVVT